MPDLDGMTSDELVDLSLVYRMGDHADAARAAAMKAVKHGPNNARAHVALAEVLLKDGEYEAGFREYEWRSRIDPLPGDWKPEAPEWTGYRLPYGGRLLVIADQGFGDTFMFSRYLRWLRNFELGRIALGVPATMGKIFWPRLSQDFEIFSEWKDTPPHAAWVRLSSLPLIHGTAFKTIPWPSADILTPSSLSLCDIRDTLFVGFCTGGRQENEHQRERNIPPELIQPILNRPNVRGVDLGRSHDGLDWSDTAALVCQCDFVVTTDTAIAHLAGSLLRPTFVMLKYDADWRYGRDVTNPWYPTHKLFRQQEPGRWEPVVDSVMAALDRWRVPT